METIKMSELTKALNDRGIKAIFAMSGGNCGTIYIGDADADGNYEFAVGPSSFSQDEGFATELCWGVDGDEDATYFTGNIEAFTVKNMADIIAFDYESLGA